MDKIYFSINGSHYSLKGSEVNSSTTLSDYLHNTLQLHGTKTMCSEGGCGACVVSVVQTHSATKERHVFAVNSCLVHILSCHQWDITTIEGVGSRKKGYHPLQKRLAAFNGTQCGYCTPGWIMNMYSLYESSGKKLSCAEIERSFGGNLCRCTGYRPIFDAFKSFATDAPRPLLTDLEDLEKCNSKCKNKRKCSVVDNEWCVIENTSNSLLELDLTTHRWYKAFTVHDVFKILSKEGVDSYTLVAGNTGNGVFPPTTSPRIFIDISSIEQLKDTVHAENLVLGAGMSIADVMVQFKKWSENEDFKYLEEFHKHLDLVAHVPVRNIGTIGGNLAMKNMHPDFPSDIFLLFELVQATVTILHSNKEKKELILKDFLKEDLRNKLILDVKLPPLSASYYIRTYKLMPRAQNAHAIINAGFLFKLDSNNIVTKANIVLGAISPTFIRAQNTEHVFIGLDLFSNETVQKAVSKLKGELFPEDLPPEPSPYCRTTLALNLLYKAVLSLCPFAGARYKSGGSLLERGVSKGTQTYDTDKKLWPLNQPIPKLEALTQCSGEAKFSCDINPSAQQIHVAFVLSTVCKGEIVNIDESEAMKLPGVVAFFTATDIPGKNTFTPLDVPWIAAEEEILASKSVLYYGQPIALIAAVTHKLALSAAELVKVTYNKSKEKPVLSIQDALIAPDKDRRVQAGTLIEPTNRGTDVQHVIKGTFSMPSQYHFTMETQCCVVTNTENGVKVRSSTQWMDLVQVAVAQMLGLPENKVEVEVPRVGGGYGGKASRSGLVACATALVAYSLDRAATLTMSLTDNMRAVGKRQPSHSLYEAGVNNDGVIQYLNINYYLDCGISVNDTSEEVVGLTLTQLYRSDTWTIKGYNVFTDTPSHTWCRAPGTAEATAIIEHIMEHIAFVTKKDPIDVRISNIDTKSDTIKDMITSFKKDCDFVARKAEIAKFNSENAWRKRALNLSLMSFPVEYGGNHSVTISVYHADGTVVIGHGGIEMGQGINTKVAQVCAYTLKIPLEKIAVRGSDTFTSPNNIASSGSVTSECVAYAVIQACNELKRRLDPFKDDMNDPTWEELVKKAFDKGINLQASYMMSQDVDSLRTYKVYGVCASETELDVLCCSHIVRRLDLLEDTGVSLSPELDVGQIEGAFIMGLGLWTAEQLIYDKPTGRLLTDRTWTYKPCGARDIPVDLRVAFQRNSVNNAGVLRSKATGEPALVLAVGVIHALHECIHEARREYGYNDTEWIHVDTPYTVENMLKAIQPKTEYYQLK